MNHHVHAMRSHDADPTTAGDMSSWFFFYKWRAAETSIPSLPSYEGKAQPGDLLWFAMDDVLIGAALITGSFYSSGWGKTEYEFNSDEIRVPPGKIYIQSVQHIEGATLQALWDESTPLSRIPEGDEPSWLKSFLIRKSP